MENRIVFFLGHFFFRKKNRSINVHYVVIVIIIIVIIIVIIRRIPGRCIRIAGFSCTIFIVVKIHLHVTVTNIIIIGSFLLSLETRQVCDEARLNKLRGSRVAGKDCGAGHKRRGPPALVEMHVLVAGGAGGGIGTRLGGVGVAPRGHGCKQAVKDKVGHVAREHDAVIVGVVAGLDVAVVADHW